VSPPTKLRSERALKVGGIALSFGVFGGLLGVADGDILKVLLGFPDLILGAIFYAHEGVAFPLTSPYSEAAGSAGPSKVSNVRRLLV
jgi:hypothetical protein